MPKLLLALSTVRYLKENEVR